MNIVCKKYLMGGLACCCYISLRKIERMKFTIPCLVMMTFVLSCAKKDPAPLDPPAPEPKVPTIASLSVSSGHPETEVTISGTDFIATSASNEVKFNGVVAEVKSAATNKLVVKVPVLAGTGAVTVKTAAGTATGPSFEYLPDTLLAGTEFLQGTNNAEAKYWKNGVGHSFFGNTHTSNLNDMIIVGPDMYAVGEQWNGTANVAMLWKNGVVTKLTDGTHEAHARRVKVVGNDVYVVGDEGNDKYSVAKYWKNGSAVSLSDGLSNASAWDLAMSGSDMYAVGSSEVLGGVLVAMLWKNGVAGPLYTGPLDAYANHIAISGADVYVAGSMVGVNGPYHFEPTLWKNGANTSLADGHTGGVVYLLINNGDVYVGVHDGRRASYWKNGQQVFLSDGTNIAHVNGLFLSGNDVYAVGMEAINGSIIGRYWKNGTAVSLGNTGTDVYLYRMAIR